MCVFLTLSCSTPASFDTSKPEGAYKQAGEYEKFERYVEAIEKYKAVKNNFPYSKYAKMSDLKVADLNFKRESFIEAQSSYQLYKDYYPRDKNIDYITYQIGLSYFHQLPKVIGRDLSGASDAIRVFTELERTFPKSNYTKLAKIKKAVALKMLAQKQIYVADFYFKTKKYVSALSRYEALLNNYSNLGFNKRALLGAALSAHRSNNTQKTDEYSKKLTSLFKDSPESKKLMKELK